MDWIAPLKTWLASLRARRPALGATPAAATVAAAQDCAGELAAQAHALRAAGDRDAARSSFEAALGLYQDMAETGALRPQARDALASVYLALGEIYQDVDEPDEAETCYRAAIALREDLLERAPFALEAARAVAQARQMLGDLINAGGAPETAQAHYAAALTLWRRVAAAQPRNATALQDLSRGLAKLAAALMDQGEIAEADALLAESFAIAEKSAATARVDGGRPAYS